jgi:hypothetical protein
MRMKCPQGLSGDEPREFLADLAKDYNGMAVEGVMTDLGELKASDYVFKGDYFPVEVSMRAILSCPLSFKVARDWQSTLIMMCCFTSHALSD